MNIVVSFKAKWGKELFYPESEDALFLTKLTGRPTLLLRQLHMALERGWKVQVLHVPFDLEGFLNKNNLKQIGVKNE